MSRLGGVLSCHVGVCVSQQHVLDQCTLFGAVSSVGFWSFMMGRGVLNSDDRGKMVMVVVVVIVVVIIIIHE